MLKHSKSCMGLFQPDPGFPNLLAAGVLCYGPCIAMEIGDIPVSSRFSLTVWTRIELFCQTFFTLLYLLPLLT